MKFFTLEMNDLMADIRKAEAKVINAKMNDDPKAYSRAMKQWQRAIQNEDAAVIEDSMTLLNAL